MLLLTGPAGSGKTSLVMESFGAAVARQDSNVRLLAPTATMARHIQNRIARRGLVPRPSLIQTLSRFIEPWATMPQVSQAHLYLTVEAAARRVNRPEFSRVVHMPGFLRPWRAPWRSSRRRAAIRGSWRAIFPIAPCLAFLAVFEEVDRELERRGLAMRGTRLGQVAGRIRARGCRAFPRSGWMASMRSPIRNWRSSRQWAATRIHRDLARGRGPDAPRPFAPMGFSDSGSRGVGPPAVDVVEAPTSSAKWTRSRGAFSSRPSGRRFARSALSCGRRCLRA